MNSQELFILFITNNEYTFSKLVVPKFKKCEIDFLEFYLN